MKPVTVRVEKGFAFEIDLTCCVWGLALVTASCLMFGCNRQERFARIFNAAPDAVDSAVYGLAQTGKAEVGVGGGVYDVDGWGFTVYKVDLSSKVFIPVYASSNPLIFLAPASRGRILLQNLDGSSFLFGPNGSVSTLPPGIVYCRVNPFDPDRAAFLKVDSLFEMNLGTLAVRRLGVFGAKAFHWEGEESAPYVPLTDTILPGPPANGIGAGSYLQNWVWPGADQLSLEVRFGATSTLIRMPAEFHTIRQLCPRC